ncbi:MAG: helix-turn-helix domain-containing protein [Firmicutes bacterium]|nr:helix-turn-helix domain-containing protein [Bacillota bacterium]
MVKFSERLKEMRLEKNLTQAQLAKETGLSQNGIANWENEKRLPNINALITLAKFFGVTVGQLAGTEEY